MSDLILTLGGIRLGAAPGITPCDEAELPTGEGRQASSMGASSQRHDPPVPVGDMRPPQLEHLLDFWPVVASRIKAARRLALFLDFDGTLAPFRRRPESVFLARSTCRALEDLVRHPKIRLWIISGRRRSDVQSRVGVKGISYLGLHGLEDGRHPLRLGLAGRKLHMAREMLTGQLRGLRGLWVEDKVASFTIHYRTASAPAVRRAEGKLGGILDTFQGHLRRLSGNSAWEIVPKDQCDKGIAVRRELRRLGGSPLVIYVGDEGSDELAFAALPGALTVCVAPRHSTHAQFALRSTTEVRKFLGMLLKELHA